MAMEEGGKEGEKRSFFNRTIAEWRNCDQNHKVVSLNFITNFNSFTDSFALCFDS